MEAGRELDERVAIEVMGWQRDIDFQVADGQVWRDFGAQTWALWLPSKQIAAAWMVVEHLMSPEHYPFAGGPHFEMSRCGSQWIANFAGDLVHAERADTVPHAICLAALRAVEGVE